MCFAQMIRLFRTGFAEKWGCPWEHSDWQDRVGLFDFQADQETASWLELIRDSGLVDRCEVLLPMGFPNPALRWG
jgi:hypothetical protein